MPELYPAPNLDVDQMQYELAAQANMYAQPYSQGTYGDQQAVMTGYRASYGDVPAMMMSGMQSTGNMMMGAASGAGSMLSGLGSMISPSRYAPPARVFTGYYGQYQQHTGMMQNLAIMTGHGRAPRGVNAYAYQQYAAGDLGERLGTTLVSGGTVLAGLTAGSSVGGALGTVAGGILGSPFGPAGMAAGAAIGGLAGNLGGYMAVDSMADLVGQRRQINSFLENSSFRYVGAGSSMADPRMGAGMSYAARRSATDFVKGMDVKDPTMDMDDLTGILKTSTDLGLFSGSKDMGDFKKKFKEIVEGVKMVSKTLNTTLEEGLQFIKDFKGIGVDASAMGSIGMQANVLGKVAGRTSQEMVGLGLQGAELFRGTGFEMKIGYQANVMNLASIRSARDAGLISQESVSQAGGEEAMAQRMTAGSLQFMQSAMGRGYGAAYYQKGAGPGGFSEASYRADAMSGKGNLIDQTMRGIDNLSSPEKMIGYTVGQDDFMSAMGKTFGGQGAMIGELRSAKLSAKYYQSVMPGLDDNTAMKYALMTDQGKTGKQAEELMAVMNNASKSFADAAKAMQSTQVAKSVDENYAARGMYYQWENLKDKVGGAIDSGFTIPGLGWNIGAKSADHFIDRTKEAFVNYQEKDLMGLTRFDVSGINYQNYGPGSKAVGTGTPSSSAYAGSVPAYSDRALGAVDLTGGSNISAKFSHVTSIAAGSAAVAGTVVGGAALMLGATAPFAPIAGGIAAGVGGLAGAAYGLSTVNWSGSTGDQLVEAIEGLSGNTGVLSTKRKGKETGGDLVLKTTSRHDLHKDYGSQSMFGYSGDMYHTTVSRKDLSDIVQGGRQYALMTPEQIQKMEDDGEVKALDQSRVTSLLTKLNKNGTLSLENISQGLFNGRGLSSLNKSEYASMRLATKGLSDVDELYETERKSMRYITDKASELGIYSTAALKDKLSDIGGQTLKAAGLESSGAKNDAEVLSLMMDARMAETAEGRTKSFNAAIDKKLEGQGLEKSLANREALRPNITRFGESAFDSYAQAAGSTLGAIYWDRMRAGGESYYGSAAEQLKGITLDPSSGLMPVEGRKMLAGQTIKNILTGKDGAQTLLGLDQNSSVGQDISTVAVGRKLFDVQGFLKDIKETSEAMNRPGADKKALGEGLGSKLKTADFLDPVTINKVVKDVADNKGNEALSSTLHAFNFRGAPDAGAAGPGKPVGASSESTTTGQGTSQEIAQQQMNINLEVLEALRAINASRR